jgi:hypothetical protein
LPEAKIKEHLVERNVRDPKTYSISPDERTDAKQTFFKLASRLASIGWHH